MLFFSTFCLGCNGGLDMDFFFIPDGEGRGSVFKVQFFGLGKAFMVMAGDHGSVGWLGTGRRCVSSRRG